MRRGRLAVLAVVATSLAWLVVSPAVQAATDPYQPVCQGAGSSSPVCNNGGGTDPLTGPNGAIVSATSILAVIAGVVSVAFLVWGGFKYITSGGDSSGVSSAKQTIIAALVGLVLTALARPIVVFIVSRI